MGVDVGQTLHSRNTGVKIINHIACESRSEMVKSIVTSQSKISVLVDESTTLRTHSAMVVFIRAAIRGRVVNIFLDLIPV